MLDSTRTAAVGFVYRLGQGSNVPLPKVPGAVSFFPEQLGKGDFLALHVSGIGKIDSIAVGMAPGEHAAPGWGTDRSCRIEAVKAQPGSSHPVQVRGLDYGVSVKTGIPPAEVIAHHQDNVRGG